MQRLASEKLLAGVLFLAIGVAGLWVGRSLNVGTAAEMGEGFVPLAMCWALVLLGALIAASGWLRPGSRVEPIRWRPLIWVSASVLVFAAALEPLGVLVATFIAVVLAALAGERVRARGTIALALILALAVLAIFVWGLGLPLRALPTFATFVTSG